MKAFQTLNDESMAKVMAKFKSGDRWVWLHAASVGEAEALIPVLEYSKAEEIYFVFTGFSPSLDKFFRSRNLDNSPYCLFYGYSPNEGDWSGILDKTKSHPPDYFLTYRYEFWPSLIFSLYQNHIPLVVLGAKWRRSYNLLKIILSTLPIRSINPDSVTQRDGDEQSRLQLTSEIGKKKEDRFELVFVPTSEGEGKVLAKAFAKFSECRIAPVSGDPRWKQVRDRAARKDQSSDIQKLMGAIRRNELSADESNEKASEGFVRGDKRIAKTNRQSSFVGVLGSVWSSDQRNLNLIDRALEMMMRSNLQSSRIAPLVFKGSKWSENQEREDNQIASDKSCHLFIVPHAVDKESISYWKNEIERTIQSVFKKFNEGLCEKSSQNSGPTSQEVRGAFVEIDWHIWSNFRSIDLSKERASHMVKENGPPNTDGVGVGVKKPHITIWLMDTMGWLAELYGIADWSYVGGGFEKGVHSTIEPAWFGIPVACGPKGLSKFAECSLLQQRGQLAVVRDVKDWEVFLNTLNTAKISEKMRENWIMENQSLADSARRIWEWVRT